MARPTQKPPTISARQTQMLHTISARQTQMLHTISARPTQKLLTTLDAPSRCPSTTLATVGAFVIDVLHSQVMPPSSNACNPCVLEASAVELPVPVMPATNCRTCHIPCARCLQLFETWHVCVLVPHHAHVFPVLTNSQPHHLQQTLKRTSSLDNLDGDLTTTSTSRRVRRNNGSLDDNDGRWPHGGGPHVTQNILMRF